MIAAESTQSWPIGDLSQEQTQYLADIGATPQEFLKDDEAFQERQDKPSPKQRFSGKKDPNRPRKANSFKKPRPKFNKDLQQVEKYLSNLNAAREKLPGSPPVQDVIRSIPLLFLRRVIKHDFQASQNDPDRLKYKHELWHNYLYLYF